MGRVKDLWQDAQDALIEKYLEEHPEADGEEAYEASLPHINDEMTDRFYDQVDRARDEQKERWIEEGRP